LFLQAIYGRSSSKSFVSEIYVPVNFHSKSPSFNEEIKIALPLNLTSSHHILFTFIHVSCTAKKGKDDEVKNLELNPDSFLFLNTKKEGKNESDPSLLHKDYFGLFLASSFRGQVTFCLDTLPHPSTHILKQSRLV